MFCDKACYDKYQSGERKTVVCGACSEEFEAKKDHGKWQRFCNRKCFKSQEHGRKDIDCLNCGKQFQSNWKSDREEYNKYCSKDCFTVAQTTRITINCANCGKEFLPPKWKSDKRTEIFCSRECHAEKRCGENSPSYKGGEYVSDYNGFRFVAMGPHVANVGYRGEHRLLVEKMIGRKLKYHSEPILHLNGNKADNSPENLYVCEDMTEMGLILQGRLNFPRRSNIQDLI